MVTNIEYILKNKKKTTVRIHKTQCPVHYVFLNSFSFFFNLIYISNVNLNITDTIFLKY
jgi:hypothetical protein